MAAVAVTNNTNNIIDNNTHRKEDMDPLTFKKFQSEASHYNNIRKDQNTGKLEQDLVNPWLQEKDTFWNNNTLEAELQELKVQQEDTPIVPTETDGFLTMTQTEAVQVPEYVIKQKNIPDPVLGMIVGSSGLLVFLVLLNFAQVLLV
jgi:hypothetical protein